MTSSMPRGLHEINPPRLPRHRVAWAICLTLTPAPGLAMAVRLHWPELAVTKAELGGGILVATALHVLAGRLRTRERRCSPHGPWQCSSSGRRSAPSGSVCSSAADIVPSTTGGRIPSSRRTESPFAYRSPLHSDADCEPPDAHGAARESSPMPGIRQHRPSRRDPTTSGLSPLCLRPGRRPRPGSTRGFPSAWFGGGRAVRSDHEASAGSQSPKPGCPGSSRSP